MKSAEQSQISHRFYTDFTHVATEMPWRLPLPPAPQLCFDTYRLDAPNQQLWRGSQALHLTPKAVRALDMLLAHAGQLVTKEQLFRAVWPDTPVSDGVLTNCIGELRQALADPAQTPHFIQTVHRRGYRFLVEEVEEACEALVRRGQFLRAHGVDEAREVLAPVYSWFTEDFDTADLQEADTLLEELW